MRLYVNNDIPPVITEAVLSCLYSNKRTISGVVDEVKLSAVCSELSIKVTQLKENQWDLESPLNTDNLQCFLSSGEFCDVIFVVEGEKLCGHRAIVCCHSDVLSAMLSGGFAESHQKEVVKAHIIIHILLTLHTGDDTRLQPSVFLLSIRMAVHWQV